MYGRFTKRNHDGRECSRGGDPKVTAAAMTTTGRLTGFSRSFPEIDASIGIVALTRA